MPASGPVPMAATGYALPFAPKLAATNPSLLGEGSTPQRTTPAGPVSLALAAGTEVNAVTAGTTTVTPADSGTSKVVLTGNDGATYTYTDVAAATPAGRVTNGAQIGVAGPDGITFSISVPDVHGMVDADRALQTWAADVGVDIHSLPSTVAPPSVIRNPQRVLVVTDPGTTAIGANLAGALAGQTVTVKSITVSEANQLDHQVANADRALRSASGRSTSGRSTSGRFASGRFVSGQSASSQSNQSADGQSTSVRRLVVVALANGTPSTAAALLAHLPAGEQVLWVAPPGTTPQEVTGYRALVTAHPGLRVESLPTALGKIGVLLAAHKATAPQALSAATAQATASLVASYASAAYRLDAASAAASTVVAWAQAQLGKPYEWGADGPDSFDCSGLTKAAFAQAGIMLPHNADAQWLQTRSGTVTEDQLTAGDLVFFAGSDGTAASPGHVGIYVGDGEVIDAPYRGAFVRFDAISPGGYVGATDPFAGSDPQPATATNGDATSGTVTADAAGLNQYQVFAKALTDATWTPDQFAYLDELWNRESSWNPAALNPVSGAYGIPQALPPGKMVLAGQDWATDPYTQVAWGVTYIQASYGSPEAAWHHELAFGWY